MSNFRPLFVLCAALALAAGCLSARPSPLPAELMAQLVESHDKLKAGDLTTRYRKTTSDEDIARGRDPVEFYEPCDLVGIVRGKVYAEEAPSGTEDAWFEIARATDAAMAACGNLALSTRPGGEIDPAAREQWAKRAAEQLEGICTHVSRAAALLRTNAIACT